MSPWELREHLGFLGAEAQPGPELNALAQLSAHFVRNWQALWAQYGEDRAGWPHYRRELGAFADAAQASAGQLRLRNGYPLMRALAGIVLGNAITGRD